MTKKILRLDSMTLRGVGSYFHGAELKFSPLTVLCGKNGSGKSTWFNAIRLLQRSLLDEMFPFSLDAHDDVGQDRLTNDRLLNTELAELDLLAKLPEHQKDEAHFGPWGTIGVSATAVGDRPLFSVENEGLAAQTVPSHPAAQILWLGICSKDAKFRVRLADPQSSPTNDYCEKSFVELVFNDVYTIRMTRQRHSRAGASPHALECSRAFYYADGEGDDEIINTTQFYLGAEGPGRIEELSPLPSGLSHDLLLKACIRLVRSVCGHCLQGFFLIGAVRDRQEISTLEEPSVLDPTVTELIQELEKPFAERKRDFRTPRMSEQLIQAIRDNTNRLADEERILSRYVGPHGESYPILWRKFSENTMFDRATPHQYPLESFVSFWLNKLLQVGIYDAEYLPQSVGPKPFCGHLLNTDPVPPTLEEQSPGGVTWKDLCRLEGTCFRYARGPANFSSGFHQLMPIIVQAAVMQRGEIMAIENPEVHLHPSLQLAVAEFILHQVLGEKTILVETHSDLIIRRLMRAVLQEEITQEALGIQFVALRRGDVKQEYSILEPLRINDKGQIENWPDGFMDDDVKESRRLLDIIYGHGRMPHDDQGEE